MPSSSGMTPKRILAVKLADLGDLLTVSPALQALRAAHPSARLDLLAPPSSAGLLRGAPYLDNVVTFDKFAFDSLRGLLNARSLLATTRFLRALRAARYDALVIFHHFTMRYGALKFGLLALASGASVRVGLDNGRGRFLTARAPDRGFGARHEADYWLEVAALLGADVKRRWRPYLPVSEADRAAAACRLEELRREQRGPLVAMHPGVGAYSPARAWPLERFSEVAAGLIDAGASVVILGGPGETERGEELRTMLGERGEVLNLAGRTSIHESAAILEACDLFVGNDSGPMHMAVAMRTPVVAVFGPSNAKAWGPYSPESEKSPHTIVARELPCQPCFYRAHSLGLRHGCGPRPCLTGLGSEPVLFACKRALGL